MTTRWFLLTLAASSALACSSASEDTSSVDGGGDESADSQTSDGTRDADGSAVDTSHPGDTTSGGDSSHGDTTSTGDSTTTSDSGTGDTPWMPDGDCDLPPSPIVDCSHAKADAGTCGGPPPDFDAGTYAVGCTAIIPETSGTTCGPLHCTCTDLGAAGTGWQCT